ncbi:MAG TPA: LLM class flavin-dependent oxidoreductase, partial [Gemmatimonadales bacterium]
GALIYTDNGTVDPWLVAHTVIASTTRFRPLIAVQPIYLHPYAAAKMVASLAFMHGRRVCLNMVAGGFKNDLEALNDPTPHDERYARLIEYTTLMLQLLEANQPVTFDGQYYKVKNLRLAPAVPPHLMPEVFVSGSSAAGMDAARALGALAVQYPKPTAEYAADPRIDTSLPLGIRIGIVARETSTEAWAVARARFPVDRKGQLTRQLAMQVSDSEWHRQIAELGSAEADADNPYWTIPFENYRTSCPYLVGSHERVADEIARYVQAGYHTVILDVPPSEEELRHTGVVSRLATERVAL